MINWILSHSSVAYPVCLWWKPKSAWLSREKTERQLDIETGRQTDRQTDKDTSCNISCMIMEIEDNIEDRRYKDNERWREAMHKTKMIVATFHL